MTHNKNNVSTWATTVVLKDEGERIKAYDILSTRITYVLTSIE